MSGWRRAAGLCALAVAIASCAGPETSKVRPAATPATWVGSAACATCHTAEAALWRDSHHDLAMAEATEATVLGDFGAATFAYGDTETRFDRRDGRFFVRTDGPDGRLEEFEVAFTFGVEPLQQYLIGFDDGRYQALPIVWDSRPAEDGGGRWFHLYPEPAVDHRDPMHWTRPQQNWNHMCAECHSTGLVKGYDPAADRFATTFAEIDVACEACHGKGSRHVAWAEATARGEEPEADLGLTVDLADRSGGRWVISEETGIAERTAPRTSQRELDICARCHSRRSPLDSAAPPGRPLLDTHLPVLLEEGLYHADGQILDEVYVYGSFLQSRMHAAGVTCTDCHDPHRLEIASPDAVCATCHAPGRFASTEHHFHAAGSEGASCVGCHMPSRVYMGVDERHDHSFRVPRPDLALDLGVPDACTACHTDRTAEWAVAATASWYGGAKEEPYGRVLAVGRRGGPGVVDELARLAADGSRPAIVRATALALLGRQPSAATGTLERALTDADPLVRLGALRGLESVEPAARLTAARPALSDPRRAVRVEAARLLAGNPGGGPELEAAVEELRQALRTNADRAPAQVALGNLSVALGELTEAERAYRQAVKLDPLSPVAAVNLADFLRSTERDGEGRALLEKARTELLPDGGVEHAWGLALVRAGRSAEALAALERAAELSPEVARYGYVHAVAVAGTEGPARAVALLEEVARLHPGDADVLAALVAYESERGRREAAAGWTARLRELAPGHPALGGPAPGGPAARP